MSEAEGVPGRGKEQTLKRMKKNGFPGIEPSACWTAREVFPCLLKRTDGIIMLYILPIDRYNEGIIGNGSIFGRGDGMQGAAGVIKDSVTELSRLQDWMLPVREAAPDTYDSMHKRYLELKVTLSGLGVNLAELDRIKE